MLKFIGVDIGGSHITGAQIDIQRNIVLDSSRRRKRVDSHGNSDYILDEWTVFLKELIGEHSTDQVIIGFAMPGPFDYKEGVSYIKGLDKYESLYGMNIKQILAQRLNIPTAHIFFRNDAEAFLHGEIIYAHISPHKKVIGVTLGTGLGSAISSEYKSKDVFRAIDPMHDGIAEDYISTRWFVKRYKELTGKEIKGVESLLSDDINPETRKLIFNEFSDNLGTFLNNFSSQEQSDVIVMGGNIAKCLDIFVDQVKDKIDNKGIQILQSQLWEDAALLGAIYHEDNVACDAGISEQDDKLLNQSI